MSPAKKHYFCTKPLQTYNEIGLQNNFSQLVSPSEDAFKESAISAFHGAPKTPNVRLV
jgi:hypothetical protein